MAQTAECLSERAKGFYDGFEKKMLLSPDEWAAALESGSNVRPYMDPLLKGSAKLYAEFISELLKAKVVCLRSRRKCEVTPFFVGRKDGRLRTIIDARVPNLRMRRPPSCPLAAGSAPAELYLPKACDLYLARYDIKDHFYRRGSQTVWWNGLGFQKCQSPISGRG